MPRGKQIPQWEDETLEEWNIKEGLDVKGIEGKVRK